ncbi:MAG: methionyl-tRNA formyltransferase [Bacteroidetes bacterium]|nr:MAG: methionyl-tRNA formyltransferase [Bacteroidota bacterium]
MGTPEFAVPSLQILVENNWPVVAVVTAPDRKKGRGQMLATSPVKDYAVANNIPVLQPTKLKDPAFLDELRSFEANLQVVVAFRMLPKDVWQMPALGTLNLHASLLPNYRGAAPINWAIIKGEKETGVTTFFLQHEIDTGEIILQEKEPIDKDDTVGSLYERLMLIGSKLVLKTIDQIAAGKVKTTPQEISDNLQSAPKIFKDTCKINWQSNYCQVNNFVRGLNPYPTAWTIIEGKTCKIYNIQRSDLNMSGDMGSFITDHKKKLYARCSDVWISIEELQMEGKKKMKIEDFLRGNPLLNLPDTQ